MQSRRNFLRAGITAGITPALPLLTTNAAGKKGIQPNFILILSDDQGWNMTSTKMDPERDDSKSDFFLTPQLERFARAGMKFSNGYSPSPLCSPSRHAIQFGQTTARLRMVHNPVTPRLDKAVSIAQMLKKGNKEYKTAHFGKWHIKISTPEQLGYDESDGSTNNGEGIHTSPRVQPVKLDDDPKKIFSITEKSINFMKKQIKDNNPFYLQISHYADHLDVVARKETVDKYNKMKKGKVHIRPEFAAMNEDLDTGVGLILDKVKELGLSDNTYIFYMADNGARTEHGTNVPLKDGKFNIWEGGIRVPFFVIGPGVKPGSVCKVPVNDPCSAIRLGKYKLFNYFTQDKLVLYDLETDISEEKDISKKHPEKTDEMNKLLMAYLKKVDATFEPLKKIKKKKRR